MKSYKQSLFFSLFLIGLLQITMLAALLFSSVVHSATPQPPTAATTPDLSTALSGLAARADLIVRAQVVGSTGQWNRNHSQIETHHKLAIRYALAGKPMSELVVRTEGGFLPAEGIGMRSSHTPTFAPGEEVLVFLQRAENVYTVVEGEAGKFTVYNAAAVSAYYRAHLALDQVVTTIQAAAQSQGQQVTLPADWRTDESTISPRQVNLAPQTLVDPKWPGAAPKIRVKVNLNSSHIGGQGGSAEEFLGALQNALRTWSVVGGAEFTFLYDGATASTTTGFNSANEIVFMKQGTNNSLGKAMVWYTSNGTIIEADIWINEDYLLNATADPQENEIDLESIVLHELGHWLPLAHINAPNAIMYAVLSPGVRKTGLSSEDIDGITALYPCPAIPCVDPIYANDSTLTPTLTATASITSTVVTGTPTPTLTVTISPSEAANTPTATPTLIPSAVTPSPETNAKIFLPIVNR